MAASTPLTRFYSDRELGLSPSSATTGVWASQLSSGITSLHKAAAATTSVVNLPIPKSGGGQYNEDKLVSVIKVFYKVATADLTSSPTAVLEKITAPTGTGIVAKTDVAQTVTFGGVEAVDGKTSTSGDHILIVTVTAPAQLANTDSLVLEVTMGEAATSVLDIFGIQVTYL